jgi:hypothetical protein
LLVQLDAFIAFAWQGTTTATANRPACGPAMIREERRLASAIIIVDEIDLHLHPQWQREIWGGKPGLSR